MPDKKHSNKIAQPDVKIIKVNEQCHFLFISKPYHESISIKIDKNKANEIADYLKIGIIHS